MQACNQNAFNFGAHLKGFKAHIGTKFGVNQQSYKQFFTKNDTHTYKANGLS